MLYWNLFPYHQIQQTKILIWRGILLFSSYIIHQFPVSFAFLFLSLIIFPYGYFRQDIANNLLECLNDEETIICELASNSLSMIG